MAEFDYQNLKKEYEKLSAKSGFYPASFGDYTDFLAKQMSEDGDFPTDERDRFVREILWSRFLRFFELGCYEAFSAFDMKTLDNCLYESAHLMELSNMLSPGMDHAYYAFNVLPNLLAANMTDRIGKVIPEDFGPAFGKHITSVIINLIYAIVYKDEKLSAAAVDAAREKLTRKITEYERGIIGCLLAILDKDPDGVTNELNRVCAGWLRNKEIGSNPFNRGFCVYAHALYNLACTAYDGEMRYMTDIPDQPNFCSDLALYQQGRDFRHGRVQHVFPPELDDFNLIMHFEPPRMHLTGKGRMCFIDTNRFRDEVAEGLVSLKKANSADVFYIRNGVLNEYSGPGGDVVIPEGVTRINSSVFEDCETLTSIVIPGSVERIGIAAFEGCANLEKVTFSDGLKEICMCAFRDCYNLKIIDLPDTLETIGALAFQRCLKLRTIYIPAKLGKVRSGVFDGCISLGDVVVVNPQIRYSDDEPSFNERSRETYRKIADILGLSDKCKDLIDDPQGYFMSHLDTFPLPFNKDGWFDGFIIWVGIADALMKSGNGMFFDLMDDCWDDLRCFLDDLEDLVPLNLTVNASELDPDGDVVDWMDAISDSWDGYDLAGLDIDGENYLLFVCGTYELQKLIKLADSVGQSIIQYGNDADDGPLCVTGAEGVERVEREDFTKTKEDPESD